MLLLCANTIEKSREIQSKKFSKNIFVTYFILRDNLRGLHTFVHFFLRITVKMQTRSQGRAQAIERHPQALQMFRDGVGSVLRQWTALELAVHNQWGGHQSAENAERLVVEIIEMFHGPDKIYKDVRCAVVYHSIPITHLNFTGCDSSLG